MKDFEISSYTQMRLREVGFWFVDIPRTGSTSLKAALSEEHGRVFGKAGVRQGVRKGLIPDHTPAIEMRNRLGEEFWDQLFTFSFVRNPWDRMVSMYLYRSRIRQNIDVTFRDYILQLREMDSGTTPLYNFHGFYYENWRYVCDDEGDQIVDFIGKYENRDDDLKIVSKATGISYERLARQKFSVTERKAYAVYYDEETRQLIADRYARDIELFDYVF